MKKNASNKGLLLPWLKKALNEQLYKGLRWTDKQKGIFCILWTHKSAEHWSKNDLEPFEAWAAHKGKREGKNEKQLKATFRCALNSKKELKEIKRDRSRRYWQFVDPNSTEKDSISKKKRKSNSLHANCATSVRPSENVNSTSGNELSSLRINISEEAEIPRSAKLPAFESICSFASLTPPHQANEISYNSTDSSFSEGKTNGKERYRLDSELDDHITSSILNTSISNTLTSRLSPTRSSFEEYRTNYTPPPDRSRLTPSQKNFHSILNSSSIHESSVDVWQPNCWTIPQGYQESNGLSQFFLNDFAEIYKPTNQEFDNDHMDFLEMDQYVPVVDTVYNDQIFNRNEHHNVTNKTGLVNDQLEQMKLDDLFSDDVDQEACEKIMQDLDRPSTESGLTSYNS